MNVIFLMGSNMPLSPQQIADQANAPDPFAAKPFTAADFSGNNSRISGSGHCDCGGNGEFELLPMSRRDVREGQNDTWCVANVALTLICKPFVCKLPRHVVVCKRISQHQIRRMSNANK